MITTFWRPAPAPLDPTQPSLFPLTLDEMIAESGVSNDEMSDWHAIGLLSFEPEHLRSYQPYELAEVQFIASLFRSGLSRAYVARLLADLPKPYRFDPRTTAYNFHLRRWQQTGDQPAPEFEDELETFLASAVMAGDVEAIDALLERARDARDRAAKADGCELVEFPG